MAKQFAGFTEQQKNVILARNGYKGRPLQDDEALTLIASDVKYNSAYNKAYETAMKLAPGVTAKARPMANGGFVFPRKDGMGNVNRLNTQDNPEYAENIEQQMAAVNKLENTFPTPQQDERRFAEGGTAYRPPQAGETPTPPAINDPAQVFLNTSQQNYSSSLAAQQTARDALASDPSNEALVTALTAADSKVAQTNEAVQQATSQFKQTSMPTPAELIQQSTVDPLSLITQASTKATGTDQSAAGLMTPGTGQAATTTQAATGTAATPTNVAAPATTAASQAALTGASTDVRTLAADSAAAQGTLSADSSVTAAQKTPQELAQLALSPAQIAQANQIGATQDRVLQAGETIAGSTVDMARARTETNFEAATGSPSTEATVQGQLTKLMADFEGAEPPAWAAGAMRQATALMAQRGLGASSMAGQAVIQAAMESALPIAQIDASTYARFDELGLSNKQQAAMFSAEKRAEFLGIEFNQSFQTRVANAARVSEIANANFTADQQVALENARLVSTVDLANLNVSSAKVLSDAAALSQLDLTNLGNRQQAQVQNAKSFLDMDMANLSNEQQSALFRSQVVANSILTDAAAANAAAQFNTSSENQTNQFFSNLQTQVSEFNAEQRNAVDKFNAGEKNVVAQFNATQVAQREQFNAQNSLIIEQANAQWFLNIATTDNAAINQSNRDAAAQANSMSALGFGAYMQEVRDLMSYAWQTANNDADRATSLAEANLEKEASLANAKATKSKGLWGALGAVSASLIAR